MAFANIGHDSHVQFSYCASLWQHKGAGEDRSSTYLLGIPPGLGEIPRSCRATVAALYPLPFQGIAYGAFLEERGFSVHTATIHIGVGDRKCN